MQCNVEGDMHPYQTFMKNDAQGNLCLFSIAGCSDIGGSEATSDICSLYRMCRTRYQFTLNFVKAFHGLAPNRGAVSLFANSFGALGYGFCLLF